MRRWEGFEPWIIQRVSDLGGALLNLHFLCVIPFLFCWSRRCSSILGGRVIFIGWGRRMGILVGRTGRMWWEERW